MGLSNNLTAVACKPGGLTMLDLDETVFDTDAPIPDLDLTGSAWPMRGEYGYWFVHGFAGWHRKARASTWLVECLSCNHEETSRVNRLIQRRAYCRHGQRDTPTNPAT